MPIWDEAKRKAYQKAYNTRRYKEDPEYCEAQKKRVRHRQKELRKWFWKLKETMSCMRCAENHPACLVFHHRDSGKKDCDVANAITHGWGKERILKEIAKCDVLCANCHRKLHWEKRNRTPVV